MRGRRASTRRQDVHLQMRNADGSLVCCTLGTQRWQRLFGRTYGFFDVYT